MALLENGSFTGADTNMINTAVVDAYVTNMSASAGGTQACCSQSQVQAGCCDQNSRKISYI